MPALAQLTGFVSRHLTTLIFVVMALGITIPLLGNGSNSSPVVFVVALSFFIQVPLSSLYGRWIATASPRAVGVRS